MDNDYPMKIKVTYDEFIYEGMLHNFESYSNKPNIILTSYIVKDKLGNILDNFINDSTRVIILDTSKADKIEIMYANNSDMCADLKNLCDSNSVLYEKKIEEQD